MSKSRNVVLWIVVAACVGGLSVWKVGSRLGLRAAGRWQPQQVADGLELLSGPTGEREAIDPIALPEGVAVPTGEIELGEYVAWLRSLSHEELLRLSNAEFGFQESELIERLQALQGPWVVAALGALAIDEKDPLLKAVLVEGLLGAVSIDRCRDSEMLPTLDSLLLQMRSRGEDPYQVASACATAAFTTCKLGDGSYVEFMAAHLENSDNGKLLTHGYLFMGMSNGSREVLGAMLTGHSSESGRLGALEGLRNAAMRGRLTPEELTAFGSGALGSETNPRNRMLLYEMVVAAGGEGGLAWAEEKIRAGDRETLVNALTFVTLKGSAERSVALLQELVAREDLDDEGRTAVYNAFGALPGTEGRELLLATVSDPELDETTRLAGLCGLWNQPMDEPLAASLAGVFQDEGSSSMRIEALRMLASGKTPTGAVDLRQVSILDEDPLVRAEAVQLAAMQPGQDTRAWLEERLLEDDSFDVKAAALGAMVYQAHYDGDGDAALGYLSRARKLTDDAETLALIATGEELVGSFDPRRIDLELERDAEFYATMAKYTEGAASRNFSRQSRQLSGFVQALRSARR
ncbi:MAG: HEAT repeat domain-containing protein [Planctomycetota bacterium]